MITLCELYLRVSPAIKLNMFRNITRATSIEDECTQMQWYIVYAAMTLFSCNLDVDHVTLMYECDLGSMKM